MEISPIDVKKLREKTGAGIMECKNALATTNGDFAAAEKLLKEKGLAALEKRADRATNEGKIFVKTADGVAALVELASETDFVARNPEFIALGEQIAGKALEKGYTEPNGELNGLVTELATKIRENMSLKRLRLVKAAAGECLVQYIHGDGKIGVVVRAASDKPEIFGQDAAKEFVFTLALHIAAFNPYALDRSKISADYLTEQSGIFRKQMEGDEKLSKMREAKPEQFEKILQGKVDKLLKDICLLDQNYVKDDKITVAQALDQYGKQFGAKISVADYAYFKVGGGNE